MYKCAAVVTTYPKLTAEAQPAHAGLKLHGYLLDDGTFREKMFIGRRPVHLVDKALLFLQCDFYSWENSRDDAVIPPINGRGTYACRCEESSCYEDQKRHHSKALSSIYTLKLHPTLFRKLRGFYSQMHSTCQRCYARCYSKSVARARLCDVTKFLHVQRN